MLLSKINENDLKEKDINNILFNIPKDDGIKGNCIWVFGSKNDLDERLNLAVELYNNKRAPYILFAGGKGKEGTIPEAKIMKEKALAFMLKTNTSMTRILNYIKTCSLH